MQYFVGSFDGETFKNENPSDRVLWNDYGADFYAGVNWSDIEGENGEKYWMGWMSNWQYANNTPTSTWRSSTSLPRKMELIHTENGLRLKQTPISLKSIRGLSREISIKNKVVTQNNDLLSSFAGDTFEVVAEFDVLHATTNEFGFKVRKGSADESTTIGYKVDKNQLFVDRSRSDSFDYGENVDEKHQGPLPLSEDGTVKMHIFVDRSSVEVFGNNGATVITDQLFPQPSSQKVEVYSDGGEVPLKSLEIYPLDRIWKEESGFQSNLTEWNPVLGEWANTITGKQGRMEGDGFILSNESPSDFRYEADIKILDTDSHPGDPDRDIVNNLVGAGALVFRSDTTAKNAYAVNIDIKNNVVKLIKFVDGKGYDLKTYNDEGNLTLEPNKNYHLTLEVQGEKIKAYLDQQLVIDTTDSSYQKGLLGLNVWDSTVMFNQVNAYSNVR